MAGKKLKEELEKLKMFEGCEYVEVDTYGVNELVFVIKKGDKFYRVIIDYDPYVEKVFIEEEPKIKSFEDVRGLHEPDTFLIDEINEYLERILQEEEEKED